ncbi:MAG: helix-turn-helix domain-containing protein [Vagococcus fluvialis]
MKDNLGVSLKNARENKKLTQQEVANKLFITRQTISRWEQNKTLPNIYVLKELSEIYELSIDCLVQEREEERMGKRVNYFALFGSLIFNLFLFSGIALTLIILLATIWFIAILFTCLPFILAYVNLSGEQSFEWIQTILSIICFIFGIFLIPLSKKLSLYLFDFFKSYYKINLKYIFN